MHLDCVFAYMSHYQRYVKNYAPHFQNNFSTDQGIAYVVLWHILTYLTIFYVQTFAMKHTSGQTMKFCQEEVTTKTPVFFCKNVDVFFVILEK